MTRSPRVLRQFAACVILSIALAGCSGVQSSLTPAGTEGARVAILGTVLYIGAAVILTIVVVLTAFALWGGDRFRALLADQRTIIAGGVVFPVIVLSVLLVWGLTLMARVRADGAGAPPVHLRIAVVGEQWWWRVTYLDAGGRELATSANEIHLPQSRPVELILTTADVIHSFWVPSLAGKLDMIPGRINILRLEATATGAYRGQCAEYCGGAHALMALWAVVKPENEFKAWLSHEAQGAASPADPVAETGQQLFLSNGCGACHAIRGTDASGRIGPDLTHVGARLTIGAGILPTNVETFASWIRDSHRHKPENRMLPYGILSETEARAIGTYLAGLR